MLKVIIISIWIVSMAIAGSSYYDDQDQAERCDKYGFGYFTSCHECNHYKRRLRSICLECCEAYLGAYPIGQLEICQCQFAKYPNIVEFIKSHEQRSKHPNLSIIYSNITEPRLHLSCLIRIAKERRVQALHCGRQTQTGLMQALVF